MNTHADAAYAPPQEDPVARLYALAQALRHVAETLPEDQSGLMCLLRLLGADVRACAEAIDDGGLTAAEKPLAPENPAA